MCFDRLKICELVIIVGVDMKNSSLVKDQVLASLAVFLSSTPPWLTRGARIGEEDQVSW